MKITKTETTILRIPEDDPLADMPEDVNRLRPVVILRIQTDAGLEGIGLTFQQVQKYEKGANRVSAGRLQQISDRLIAKGPGAAEINPLSPRELDVLAMVAVGCGNAEAARRLGLLPETVKSYLRNAMRKLGTHGRMETIVTARRLGYLP